MHNMYLYIYGVTKMSNPIYKLWYCVDRHMLGRERKKTMTIVKPFENQNQILVQCDRNDSVSFSKS